MLLLLFKTDVIRMLYACSPTESRQLHLRLVFDLLGRLKESLKDSSQHVCKMSEATFDVPIIAIAEG